MSRAKGYRIGNVYFELEEPAFAADILRDNNIDPGNGTLTVGGVTYPGSDAHKVMVQPEQDIEISPKAEGGLRYYWDGTNLYKRVTA